jgi:pentatricopeptide repeat protein
MKKELKERFPEFDQEASLDDPMQSGTFAEVKLTPGMYLKHIDTAFESFFY